jgi:hypothetical protein
MRRLRPLPAAHQPTRDADVRDVVDPPHVLDGRELTVEVKDRAGGDVVPRKPTAGSAVLIGVPRNTHVHAVAVMVVEPIAHRVMTLASQPSRRSCEGLREVAPEVVGVLASDAEHAAAPAGGGSAADVDLHVGVPCEPAGQRGGRGALALEPQRRCARAAGGEIGLERPGRGSGELGSGAQMPRVCEGCVMTGL